MNKFKVGDKVRVLGFVGPSDYSRDHIFTIACDKHGDDYYILANNSYGHTCGHGHSWVVSEHDLVLVESITNNKTNMNIKDKFTLAFKKEPEKSFRKAGITNGDDFLTEDGTKVFLGWLLAKHGADFKKEVVDDLLKEEE